MINLDINRKRTSILNYYEKVTIAEYSISWFILTEAKELFDAILDSPIISSKLKEQEKESLREAFLNCGENKESLDHAIVNIKRNNGMDREFLELIKNIDDVANIFSIHSQVLIKKSNSSVLLLVDGDPETNGDKEKATRYLDSLLSKFIKEYPSFFGSYDVDSNLRNLLEKDALEIHKQKMALDISRKVEEAIHCDDKEKQVLLLEDIKKQLTGKTNEFIKEVQDTFCKQYRVAQLRESDFQSCLNKIGLLDSSLKEALNDSCFKTLPKSNDGNRRLTPQVTQSKPKKPRKV